MKISISKTVHEDVNLSNRQVDEITIAKLRRMVTPGEYLRKEKDKWVVKQDDPHWRHGSVSEDYVRDATELDIAVFKVISAIEAARNV